MEVLIVGSGIIVTIYGWAFSEGGVKVTHLIRPNKYDGLKEGVLIDILDERKGHKKRNRARYPMRCVTEVPAGASSIVLVIFDVDYNGVRFYMILEISIISWTAVAPAARSWGVEEVLHAGQLDEDRWEREKRIKWLDVEKLQRSRVLVIGAGALGNEAVKDLVLAGIGHITLVDMDHVVRSNLSRCVLFRESDQETRRLKAEAVAERAAELDPQAEIVPVAGRVEDLAPEAWKEHDLALGCLDNVAARLHVNSHAYYHGIPYIDGGTDGFSGRVQVVVPPATPCLQCGLNHTHYKVLEKRYSCTGADVSFYQPKVAAEITTTSIIAAVQAREAVKLLCGLEDRTIKNVLYYDGLRGRWDELELSFDPQCPLHAPQSP